MTPEAEAQDEAANNSEDSAADGIERDHGGQHDQGCAALPVAVSACHHHLGNTD
jgi:hypothetical protein